MSSVQVALTFLFWLFVSMFFVGSCWLAVVNPSVPAIVMLIGVVGLLVSSTVLALSDP